MMCYSQYPSRISIYVACSKQGMNLNFSWFQVSEKANQQTHSLHPVPNKSICSSDSLVSSVGVSPSSRPPHLTYDVSVFILAYCLPTLLVIFLAAGLTVR